jgi:alanine racemase
VRRSHVTIDLGALRRNVARLRTAAAPAELWAVVKADAYGHGVADVAPAAVEAGVAALCVATASEGEELRRVLPDARIVVLGPLCTGDAERARAERLEVCASAPEAPEGLPLHAKVDTGMGRWGMSIDEARRLPPERVVGVMSHFATADDADPSFSREQIERFGEARALFPDAQAHLANSAGTLRFPEARFDAVRCGIAIYGLSPFGADPAADGLEPVLSWRSTVCLVKTLARGASTGYGRRFIAERPTRIGIVPVGYADGWRRGLTGTEVAVGGVRRRVLGIVSMDAFAVELPEGDVGDEVVLIGDGIGVEEHARVLGTINYEITCGIRCAGGRGEREVVDG